MFEMVAAVRVTPDGGLLGEIDHWARLVNVVPDVPCRVYRVLFVQPLAA